MTFWRLVGTATARRAGQVTGARREGGGAKWGPAEVQGPPLSLRIHADTKPIHYEKRLMTVNIMGGYLSQPKANIGEK